MPTMKKNAFTIALVSIGLIGIESGAQAATCATLGACFEFNGGGDTVNNGLDAPTGSWWGMLAADTNSDYVPDSYVYTAIRAAGGAGTPGPNGFLNFTITNTITPGAGGATHNSGNMIDRDSIFYGAYGAHFTTGTLPVTYVGDNTATVDMSAWRMTWNGIPAINLGAGKPAVIDNVDGIWGNGNDTLDYRSVIPVGDPSSLGGVRYTLHLVGSYTPVPLPAAAWLLGSGLVGLMSAARRRKEFGLNWSPV